jgi:hypothetical protein
MPLGLYDPAPGGIIFFMPDGVTFQSNGNFLGFGCRISSRPALAPSRIKIVFENQRT